MSAPFGTDIDSCARFLREKLAAARGVLVLSGAGASADSGIPTFRGRNVGWAAWMFRPLLLLALGTAPGWEWMPSWINGPLYNWLFLFKVKAARPNAFHRVLAARSDVRVITLNVDGLHQRAGTPADRVAELRGTVHDNGICVCGRSYPCDSCLDGGKWRPSAVLRWDSYGRGCEPEDVQRLVADLPEEPNLLVLVVGMSAEAGSVHSILPTEPGDSCDVTVIFVNPEGVPEMPGAFVMRHGADALFSLLEHSP